MRGTAWRGVARPATVWPAFVTYHRRAPSRLKQRRQQPAFASLTHLTTALLLRHYRVAAYDDVMPYHDVNSSC